MEGDCTHNTEDWNNMGIKMKLGFVSSFFNLVF